MKPLKEGDKVRIPPSYFDPYNPSVSRGGIGRIISLKEDVKSDLNVEKIEKLTSSLTFDYKNVIDLQKLETT